MKNQKQSVKQAKSDNEGFNLKHLPEDKSPKLSKEPYLREYQTDLFKYFFEALGDVFVEADVRSTEDIKSVHIIRALFKIQNVENGKSIIDFFILACEQVFGAFEQFSQLAEEGKLTWVLRETLNPGYIWKQYNDDYKTLRIPRK